MVPPTHILDPEGKVTIVWLGRLSNSSAQAPGDKVSANLTTTTCYDAPPTAGDCFEKDEREELRMQVSATHLKFSSSYFNKLLTGGWKESKDFNQKGSVEIVFTADDWNFEPLLIVLHAIHCQHGLIPKNVTLEMLAEITLITHYYDCKEAVEIMMDIWIDGLGSMENWSLQEVALLIWVSWYFQVPKLFEQATSIAMSMTEDVTDQCMGFPIPNAVFESMHRVREQNMQSLLTLLDQGQEDFVTGARGCSFVCSSVMHGALAKQIHSNRFLYWKPEAPFKGFSYQELKGDITLFETPEWYEATTGEAYSEQAAFLRTLRKLSLLDREGAPLHPGVGIRSISKSLG